MKLLPVLKIEHGRVSFRVFNRVLSLFICSLFLITQAYANPVKVKITGKIIDETGEGLPGVSILEKGTSNGTATDIDGNYSISVEGSQSMLVFSFVGYSPKEVTVGTQSMINVSLEMDAATLEEIIVVGYGTQKKATITGAISAIKGADLIQSPAVDMTNSLSGRMAGLVVIQQSGEPGNDGALLRIRGANTLGDSSPLVVIDGIPDRDGGLGRLSPRDIESVSVLKDASAAIYGARAANGAILITTKRGKSGKPTITYDFNQGFSQPTVVPQMASSVQYANIMNELSYFRTVPASEWGAADQALRTAGTYDSPTAGIANVSAPFSPDAVARYAAGNDPWGYPNTDWFAGSFKNLAPQSRHNLQISGGGDKVRYMTSLGFVNQDAIYNNSATFYKQYNLRTNLDVDINKYITANVGIMLRREDRNYPTESAGSIFRMLMRGRPTEPQVWPNGKPGPDIENGQNPYVITTSATGYQKNPKDYAQLNGGLTLTNPWIDGLKLTLSAAVDRNAETNKVWQTPWELYFWDKQTYEADGVTPQLEGSIRSTFTDPRLSQSSSNVLNTNLSAILNYDKVINGVHNINTLVGVTRETFTGDFFFAFRRNYISSAVDQLFAGGAENQNSGGTAYERARLGYFGRVQYGYKEKYLVEFIGRYDGSYIFPESDRFGFFPGVLAGWNLTNEDFFKVKGVDYLKFRASYGQMGNDQVTFDTNGNGVVDPGELQEYAFLSSYGFGQYPINGALVNTLEEQILANSSFTWERANNYNIGLDATLFNKIDLTLEYFYNRRDQILIQQTGSTPASSGISSLLPPVNAGIVTNSGYEFSVNYNGKTNSDLRYRFGINGGYSRNNVVFMDEIPGAPDYQRMEGKPIGAYLVYQYDGVFKDQADIDASTIDYSGVTSNLLPGDMKFEDVDGDGVITADDQVRIDKNIIPRFQFGATMNLTYKNFDFSMLFQGATGAALRIQTESGDIGNYLEEFYENRWSVDAPSDVDPRLASRGDTYYTGGNFGNNTYFLRDTDYIRLKNVELGYQLPASLLSKAGISNVRFFLNGLNLITFDKLKVFDPETASSAGTNYPQSRVVNGGFSLTF
jgi:TonB-linked SusC/RagA family outer membrane protein